jgi:hypothetical protein
VALAWKWAETVEGLKRTMGLLTGVTVACWFYPVMSGQFWRYHYLPFYAFSLMLMSVGIAGFQSQARPENGRLAAAIITVGFYAYFVNGVVWAVFHQQPLPTQTVSDEVASYLRARLKPSDSVQPLDWTGGVVGGMLDVRAKLATSFLYDFPFYHSVSNPYIQGLRKRFILELGAARPAYIVERLGEQKPWPSGPDTTRNFSELQHFIAKNYMLEFHSRDFNVWILNNLP